MGMFDNIRNFFKGSNDTQVSQRENETKSEVITNP